MNILEVVSLIVLLAVTIDGVRVGCVKTVFSTIRMIIGVIVAYILCIVLGQSFPDFLNQSIAIVFLILIGIVFGILGAVEKLLNLVDKFTVTRFVNRAAGLAAGLLKGIILVWILFYVVSYYSGTEWGAQFGAMLSDSVILKLINSFNPLKTLLVSRPYIT